MNKVYDEMGYRRLAVAIVEQAAKDLRRTPKEVKAFFTNPNSLFSMCMPNYDGEAFLKQIEENYEKYDRYSAVMEKENKEEELEYEENEDFEYVDDYEYELEDVV